MTLTAPARAGVAVLLVYGVRIQVAQLVEGFMIPGMRLTVQIDGAVWVQPVGYDDQLGAEIALFRVHRQCLQAGLLVEPLPAPGKPPGLVARRRPRPNFKETPCR